MSRLADSFGKRDYLPIYHHLALLLKGTPFLLYGDELEFKKEDAYMKWDKSRGCGFSSSNETLQLSCKGNVREAMAHGSHDSLVRFYKKLIKLRAEPSFSWGELTTTTTGDENVISYVREAKGFDGYLVIANTDKDKAHFVDYKLKHDLPEKALVEYYYSVGAGGQANDFKVGETLRIENILLKPGELLILKFNRN
jgi:glycosidase